MQKEDYRLTRLRHESYNVMIFATQKPDIEPLLDFLGGANKWIDLFMKQGGGYPVKTLGAQTFRFPGNWKIQLENTTDAYHFPIVHKSFCHLWTKARQKSLISSTATALWKI
ncbi:MAG: hypothetical protein KTR17_03955 [Cellvibrionaceae bacterium]|nr:hypothetical protein [Cellvibrionaceae bacterium]